MQAVEETLERHGLAHNELRPQQRQLEPHRGMIRARLEFPQSPCFLNLSEKVNMRRGSDPREEYAYWLVTLEPEVREVHGWDRDLSKARGLQDHFHPDGSGGRRLAGTFTLDQVLAAAWELIP